MERIFTHIDVVRIVGYHGNDANYQTKIYHCTYPFTQYVNCRRSWFNDQICGWRGCCWIFLDGADGQQPIIFGTLFKQSFVEDKLTAKV